MTISNHYCTDTRCSRPATREEFDHDYSNRVAAMERAERDGTHTPKQLELAREKLREFTGYRRCTRPAPMTEHIDFKIRRDAPRVIRSPFLPDDATAYVMPGEHFEDGRSRLFVGVVPSPALEADIIAALDEADRRLRVIDDAMTTIAKLTGVDVAIEGRS